MFEWLCCKEIERVLFKDDPTIPCCYRNSKKPGWYWQYSASFYPFFAEDWNDDGNSSCHRHYDWGSSSIIAYLIQSAEATTTEVLKCFGGTPTIVGTDNDDVIQGTEGDDWIAGLGGNDRIYGNGGVDRLCGGDDDDRI